MDALRGEPRQTEQLLEPTEFFHHAAIRQFLYHFQCIPQDSSSFQTLNIFSFVDDLPLLGLNLFIQVVQFGSLFTLAGISFSTRATRTPCLLLAIKIVISEDFFTLLRQSCWILQIQFMWPASNKNYTALLKIVFESQFSQIHFFKMSVTSTNTRPRSYLISCPY